MQKFAIYDMDKTITVRPTYPPFLAHVVARRAPWRIALVPVAIIGLLAYGLKLLDRAQLKTLNQRLFLGKPSLAELAPFIDSFAEKTLRENTYQKALEQVERDRADGRTLILATASYELYVEAIARLLKFDHVIGTQLQTDGDGRVLPQIIGENCYDQAKLDRIENFLSEKGVERGDIHIRAYSDHVSDAPMLEFADEAVATTPSPALRKLAQERGWEIVDWN